MSRPRAAKSADRIDGATCTGAGFVALTRRPSSAHLDGNRIGLPHLVSPFRLPTHDRAWGTAGRRLRTHDGHTKAAAAQRLGRAVAVHADHVWHHECRRLFAAI